MSAPRLGTTAATAPSPLAARSRRPSRREERARAPPHDLDLARSCAAGRPLAPSACSRRSRPPRAASPRSPRPSSAGLVAQGAVVDVVRCEPGTPARGSARSWRPSRTGRAAQLAAAIDALNAHRRGHRAARVRHLRRRRRRRGCSTLMAGVDVPIVLIAHTVVSDPTAGQRRVLEDACAMADVVVVMTETARQRLLSGFDVDPDVVVVIPHGAATPPVSTTSAAAGSPSAPARSPPRAPRLLTWGLLGPGKGIEWAIDAFATLGDLDPAPTYVIAGATHPKVREHSGERYREMLDRARRAGRGRLARGLRRHLPRPRVPDRADPLGRPRRAAVRLRRPGHLRRAGRRRRRRVRRRVDRVPARRRAAGERCRDSSCRSAIRSRSPARSARCSPTRSSPRSMAAEARRLAPDLSWSAVARRYDVDRCRPARRRDRCRRERGLLSPTAPFLPAPHAPINPAWRHVLTMTDEIGMFEHADHAEPRHRARLLHRRRRSPADRDRPRAGAAPGADGARPRMLPVPRRRAGRRPVGCATAAAPTGAGTAAVAWRTAGAAACGRSAAPLASRPTAGCGPAPWRTSATPSGSARRTAGRWPSPRSAPRSCSPSEPRSSRGT